MIESQAEALAIAERYLSEVLEPEVGEPVATTTVREYPTCWVVGYNTRAFIETRAVSHALAGGPIIVNRKTGNLRIGSSGMAAEEQLDP